MVDFSKTINREYMGEVDQAVYWWNALPEETKVKLLNIFSLSKEDVHGQSIVEIYQKSIPIYVREQARIYVGFKEGWDWDDELYYQKGRIKKYMAFINGYFMNANINTLAMTIPEFKSHMLNAMNMGMSLRQQQLNGDTCKSGVEMLRDYYEGNNLD